MRNRFSVLALLISVVAFWQAGLARADLIYIGGHADLGAGFELGALHLHIHAEGDLDLYGGGTMPAGEIDPADLAIGVPGPSVGRPAGAQWDFLATNAGAPVWFLPQGSDPNKPFLGIGTEELLPAEGWLTPLTWQFNSLTVVSGGPSEFALWQNDAFLGPQIFASTLIPTTGSQNPIRTGNSWQQLPFSHDHFNYGFTGEGVYDISFSITGFNTTLAQNFSDTATFRFVTGSAITAVPEPGSLGLLGVASIVGAVWRRRALGSRKAAQ